MNSIEGILRTVRTSGGATIVPELATGISNNLGLKSIRLTNPTPRRTVGIISAGGAHRSAAAREFVKMIEGRAQR
jgi:DNA-binding transcriptional LysR family regulator